MTCDGTWARRGFQSLYGVVAVASWKTGKVLDVEVLSKHCQACATHHGMDTSSGELDWWKGHQASCEVYYCSSSSAMKSTGVLAIWKRSVSKNMLRYTQMISDGDSKTFKLLSDQLPYGASNLVSKHECVGHVQKRMGTTLREKAKEKFVNERGERVRVRGKGWLTDKKSSDPTPVTVRQCSMLSGRCFSGQRSWCKFYQGTCQFRAITTPLTHHP